MYLFAKMFFPALLFSLIATGLARGWTVQRAITPPHVAIYLPDSSCNAPCWQGINTDDLDHQATVDAILQLPNAQATGIIEWEFSPDGQHTGKIRLENGRDLFLTATDIRAGDILGILGKADWQLKGNAYDSVTGESFNYIQLAYDDYHLLVTVLVPYGARFTPAAEVRQFIYPTGPFSDQEEGEHPWQGFVWLDYHYPSFGYAPSIRLN